MVYLQRWHGWCHMKLPAVSAQVLCTPYNHALCHFMQSHIRKVYACLAVTCHLHFWQNDRDLLRATAVTRGWERIPPSAVVTGFLHLEDPELIFFLLPLKPGVGQNKCSHACSAHCQEFLRCPNFDLLGPFIVVFLSPARVPAVQMR